MRINSVVILVLVGAVGVPVAASAQEVMPGEAYHVEFGVAWWQPSPELFIQTGKLTAGGVTDFDFAEEFGLADTRFSDFRVVLKPAERHRLRFSYVPMRFAQAATLRRPITFDGRTFSGDAAVGFKWNLWRVGYEWDVVSTESGFLGIIAELKYNNVRASVSSGGASGVAEVGAAIPTVGIAVRRYLHRSFAVSGEVTGIKVPGWNALDAASFYDVDLSATWSLSRRFGVQGGYRQARATYAVEENSGRLKMGGIYFSILSRF